MTVYSPHAPHRVIGLSVTTEMVRTIDALAAREGLSRSSWVRRLIIKALHAESRTKATA